MKSLTRLHVQNSSSRLSALDAIYIFFERLIYFDKTYRCFYMQMPLSFYETSASNFELINGFTISFPCMPDFFLVISLHCRLSDQKVI